ncbi:MAG: hypothetical protein R3B13_17625 [Polyangiaceae bacterium]
MRRLLWLLAVALSAPALGRAQPVDAATKTAEPALEDGVDGGASADEGASADGGTSDAAEDAAAPSPEVSDEEKRAEAAAFREQRARYDRNYFVLRVAPLRIGVDVNDEVVEDWGGRVDGGMILPLDDGFAPAWWVLFGVGAVPYRDGVVFTVPASFAYGFHSSRLLGYLGGTFGLGGAGGDGGGAGPLYGGLAALGVRLGRVQLFAEGRYEFVLLKAGRSFSQYAYGPALALEL